MGLLFLAVNSLPFYTMAQDKYTVHFIHGKEYFPQNLSTPETYTVSAEELTNHTFVRYAQFNSILTTEQRENLEKDQVRIIGYINYATYLIGFPAGYDMHRLSAFGVRSIMAVNPLWKMHRNLKEPPFGEWAVNGDDIDVVVQVYPFITIEQGAALCLKEGFSVLEQGSQNGYLLVRLNQGDLEKAAGLPFVQWMEQKPAPGQKEDINGRSLHRSNLLDSDYAGGYKYNGEGVKVLVRDDGAVGPHIDFEGRLYNQNNVSAPLAGTHGDGVAGIIGGAGNLDPTKKGMAAGSDVYVVNYVNNFQDQTLPLFQNENVTITNSSYSDGCNEGYTNASQTVDKQIFENPALMHVFSAGNSNSLDCGYGAGTQWGNITGGHKMGKNAIATANLQADADLEPSSSRGPAYDGRLKPDISAHGASQNSTNPYNTYQVFGGTSAAAPGIAGCLAQLTQAYRTINNAPDAPTALLKASLLNTANEMGNAGPDFKFGWGHVNNYRVLKLLEEHRYTDDVINQNSAKQYQVTIPDGLKEAKLMIYWVDPEAQPNAAIALLNDLDLTVTGPDGSTFLPWKLDPTPDPVILNTPAGKGRDSLNNMEQVSIVNPAAGTYTVNVEGYAVPFGPQRFYLVWEFVKDEIKITYPNGGEGFVPGNFEWIRWDAPEDSNPFTLKYSIDGGNTYTTITQPSAAARMFQWQPPNLISGNVKMVLTRGNQSDTTDHTFSISPLPANLQVVKMCPDSVTLGWTKVGQDTVAYDLYMLGEKYMELKTSTGGGASNGTFSITDPDKEKWFSVRASSISGLTGRRTLAINYPGGLYQCPQENDMRIVRFVSPADGGIFACGSNEKPVVIEVKNTGLAAASGAKIWYQIGNQPVVEEALPDIPAGTSLNYTFANPVIFPGSGQINITAGIIYPTDTYQPDNNTSATFTAVPQVVNTAFTNTFESTALPSGWLNYNPDGALGWARYNSTIIGSSGASTRAYFLNHFDYDPGSGQEDYLYLPPFDLSNFENPVLLFDYSHAQLDALTKETLRVEVFKDCDFEQPATVVWSKTDPELKQLVTSAVFVPSEVDHWKKEAVVLDQFIGHTIVIRFVSVNAGGNNTFLDNVAIKSLLPIAPVALITSQDSICRAVPVSISAQPSPGSENSYSWTFGSLASPGSAVGPGPHQVEYPVPGNKLVRLIVTNPFGADTVTKNIHVRSNPIANYNQTTDLLTVTFNNTSTSATNYIWDFGDGSTSTAINPVHTYASAGTYTVKLTAVNPCKTAEKTTVITLTSGAVELTGLTAVTMLPNPSNGLFSLSVNSPVAMESTFALADATGKVLGEKTLQVPAGNHVETFDYTGVPAGQYRLIIQTKKGTASIGVTIVK